MSKEDIVNKLAKGADVARQNAQNEAKRLQEKVKTHNNNVKSNSQLMNARDNNQGNNQGNLPTDVGLPER